MKIAQVLHPAFTTLDVIGSYEIISRWSVTGHAAAPSPRPTRRLLRRPAAEPPHPR